jgi:hypothetical protein
MHEKFSAPGGFVLGESSLSFANGGCVQVAKLADGRIGVRDSKDPAVPVLRFSPSEWAAFIGAANGEFAGVRAD